MNQVVVHPRVMDRHPDLSEDDVIAAWENYVRLTRRSSGHVIAVGFDLCGRAVEMAAKESNGDYLIYHALTPPTVKALKELGMTRR